jgi:predicted glycosyltransferase
MRFFFYSHDGMGLGHVRRQIAIAAALAATHPDAKVLLATSVDDVAGLGLPPNVDTLKLPGLRKVANGDYASRRLGLGKKELCRLRAAVLLAAVEGFAPDVVLVDKHPFGAKGEMTTALGTAKSRGARLVLGLRDVLDDPATVASEWANEQVYERLADYFDLVLVYGERTVFDPLQHCPLPPVMAERVRYCGYVVGPAGCASCVDYCPHLGALEPLPHPSVLCTVGGGEDGSFLLKAFLGAAAGAPWKGVAVGGPLLSEIELQMLRQVAGETGVTLHASLPCLSRLFWRVDALVCMGGYNTLLEAVSKGVPTVCVPRTAPRSEQLIRAKAFEELELLRMLLPEQVTAESLGRDIAAALEQPRTELMERANGLLNFNGAQSASQCLLDLRSKPVSLRPSHWSSRGIASSRVDLSASA